MVMKKKVRFTTMVEYGERLQAALKARGLSTQQLADKLEVTYQAVKKVLDGKSSALSAPNHVRAVRILQVSSEWLALGEGVMSPSPDEDVVWPFPAVSPEQMGQLSPGDLEEIQAMINFKLSRSAANSTKKSA